MLKNGGKLWQNKQKRRETTGKVGFHQQKCRTIRISPAEMGIPPTNRKWWTTLPDITGLYEQCEAPKIAKLVYNSNNYGLWHL